MVKIPTVVEMSLDTVNLGLLLYGSHRTNKALEKQNVVAITLLASATAISVGSTLWIIKTIKGANK